MRKKDFDSALKAIKEINNLKLNKVIVGNKNLSVKIEYKLQTIKLNGYDLLIQGSLEQTFSKDHSTDKFYIAVGLLDSFNKDLTFKPKQLNEIKEILTKKILA